MPTINDYLSARSKFRDLHEQIRRIELQMQMLPRNNERMGVYWGVGQRYNVGIDVKVVRTELEAEISRLGKLAETASEQLDLMNKAFDEAMARLGSP